MTEHVFKPQGGLGNTLVQLTSLDKNTTKLHESIKDFEFGKCIDIKGFEFTDDTGEQPNSAIYINNYTVRNIHPKIRDIISPTSFMENMIQEHIHLLEGVTCGMSIRRGSYSEDSKQYKDTRSEQPAHYFCSDNGLEKFRKIIKDTPGKIFLSSDSKSTLRNLKEEFGDKLISIDDDDKFVIGMPQDSNETICVKNYHIIYLKFFLFSKCPLLYLTGGNKDLVGFSTYAYIAAIYGNKPFNLVFNSD